MSTVAQTTTPRKPAPVRHYAHLGETEGIAELLNGTGYLFRATGARTATLVAYNDVALVLHGYVQDETDEEPLGKRVASPAWYNGSDRQGRLV